jgi:hypothetical protein
MTPISRRLLLTGALGALPAAAARAFQDEGAYIRAVQAAQRQGDYAGMERLCRAAIDQGSRDEYLLRSLSWALRRQYRSAEGLTIAIRNVELNPGVVSLSNLVEAAIDEGQLDRARNAARELLRARSHWGRHERIAVEAVQRASTKTFRLSWVVPGATLSDGAIIWAPRPMNTLNQTVLAWNATGGGMTAERQDAYGNRYAEITATGGRPITITADVRLSPFNTKSVLGRVDGTRPPAELSAFLEKSVGRDASKPIDPTATDVQGIVSRFGQVSGVAAAEKMMDWINSNLTYCPPGSPDGLDDPVQVIRRRGGHCEAISSTEVALLRACRIPARMIRGQSGVSPAKSLSGQHTIVQFWLPGVGWVDWDYFHPRWKVRDDFLRLWAYKSLGEPGHEKFWDFHRRTFQELKGYKQVLLSTHLE